MENAYHGRSFNDVNNISMLTFENINKGKIINLYVCKLLKIWEEKMSGRYFIPIK